MAKIISKKVKNTILISIISILLFILLIYFALPFLVKIDFLLGSGLILQLSPQSKSINLVYGEKDNVEFKITAQNSFNCKATCDYSFIDRSAAKTIDSGNFTLSKNQEIFKNYQISIDKIGVGQDIYNFQVQCHNIKTTFCFGGDSDLKVSSALLSVNYNLSEDLNQLKTILQNNLADYLTILHESDLEIQRLSENMFTLSFEGNFNDLIIKKDKLNSEFDELRISAQNFHTLWSDENYITLSESFGETYLTNLSNLRNQTSILTQDFNNSILRHNTIINSGTSLVNEVNKLIDLSYFINQTQNDFTNNLNILINNTNNIVILATNNYFESYDSLEDDISLVNENLTHLIDLSNNLSLEKYTQGRMDLQRETDYLCLLQDNCQNIDLDKTFEKTSNLLNSGKINEITNLKDTCNLLSSQNKTYEEIKNSTDPIEITDELLAYSNNKKQNIIQTREKTYYNLFNELQLENTDQRIINNFNSTINNVNIEDFEINQDLDSNATVLLLSELNLSLNSQQYISSVCNNLDKKIELIRLNKQTLPTLTYNQTLEVESGVQPTLSDNKAQCCVFGECNDCCSSEECINDPSTFPIIFVHGHSVRKTNSPDYSLDTFDRIQKKLEGDGYLNAGVLLNVGEDQIGDWGLSGKPVSVKISYYFDVYKGGDGFVTIPTSSESIDTYGLRLKDLVEIVKRRTGKPKVNLISFSMGGLVTRKYIQIFGDNSVDKLITIGSPNQGIVGRVGGLCPVLGESKECTDMEAESIFMKKLNDLSNQPSNVKIFNIIGIGCPVSGKDGDGVVQVEKASLNGVVDSTEFFVQGTCSGLIPQFHTDLINIDKYPEVYDYVSSILKN